MRDPKVKVSLPPLRMMSYEITAETRIWQVLQIHILVCMWDVPPRYNECIYVQQTVCVYSVDIFVFAHHISELQLNCSTNMFRYCQP